MNKMLQPSDVKGDTLYDVILRAWLGHKLTELPDAQQQILERWQMVDKLIKQGEVVKVLNEDLTFSSQTKRFNFQALVEWLREKYGISARQAYEDIANAKRFFLSCEGRTDVEYARGAAIEHGEMMYWAAFEAGKFEAAAMFYKELNKIKGLHQINIETPDYSDFQPPEMVVTADPTELGFPKLENVNEAVARILTEKRKDFYEDNAEEAEVIE
jgi:hypothetical protein